MNESAKPVTRVFEGIVGDWCDGCGSQYLDDGDTAGTQRGPLAHDDGWFVGLGGKRVRVTIEEVDCGT